MGKSPGHQQHPDHKVVDTPMETRMTVEFDGEILADSSDVVRVDEDGHPARFYFPREDVFMRSLEPLAKTTECPFKGKASYFGIRTADGTLDDAAWSYEDPYDEHRDLAGRVAFDDFRLSSGELSCPEWWNDSSADA